MTEVMLKDSSSEATSVSAVDFVLGKVRANRQTISPHEWLEIIKGALELVTLEYSDGKRFRSIRRLFTIEERAFGFQKVPIEVVKKGASDTHPGVTFYLCSTLEEPPSWEKWPCVPKIDPESSLSFGEPVPVQCRYLLLSRKKELVMLTMTWERRETWDENSLVARISSQGKEAVALSIIPADLSELANPRFGVALLHRFAHLQSHIADDQQASARHARSQTERIQACLDRL